MTGTTEIILENSQVVPHSPDLLLKFRNHMNVELCISRVGSIKYLLKYVCKGSDRVTVEIMGRYADRQSENNSEGEQYQDARYTSASEAA